MRTSVQAAEQTGRDKRAWAAASGSVAGSRVLGTAARPHHIPCEDGAGAAPARPRPPAAPRSCHGAAQGRRPRPRPPARRPPPTWPPPPRTRAAWRRGPGCRPGQRAGRAMPGPARACQGRHAPAHRRAWWTLSTEPIQQGVHMHSGRVCLMHASLADVAALSLGDTLHARHQSAGGGFLWGHTLPRTRGRYRQHPSRLSDLDHLRAPVPSHRRSPEQVCAPGVANSRTSSGTSSCYCRHSCDTRLIHASLHRGRRPLAERARA